MSKQNYQQSIYDVVKMIPCGRVTSYGAIAEFLSLGSARMVGWALNRLSGNNPEQIPAHRVVNAKGVLTGSASFHPPSLMAKLLEEEGVPVEHGKVRSFEDYFWHPGQLLDGF